MKCRQCGKKDDVKFIPRAGCDLCPECLKIYKEAYTRSIQELKKEMVAIGLIEEGDG